MTLVHKGGQGDTVLAVPAKLPMLCCYVGLHWNNPEALTQDDSLRCTGVVPATVAPEL